MNPWWQIPLDPLRGRALRRPRGGGHGPAPDAPAGGAGTRRCRGQELGPTLEEVRGLTREAQAAPARPGNSVARLSAIVEHVGQVTERASGAFVVGCRRLTQVGAARRHRGGGQERDRRLRPADRKAAEEEVTSWIDDSTAAVGSCRFLLGRSPGPPRRFCWPRDRAARRGSCRSGSEVAASAEVRRERGPTGPRSRDRRPESRRGMARPGARSGRGGDPAPARRIPGGARCDARRDPPKRGTATQLETSDVEERSVRRALLDELATARPRCQSPVCIPSPPCTRHSPPGPGRQGRCHAAVRAPCRRTARALARCWPRSRTRPPLRRRRVTPAFCHDPSSDCWRTPPCSAAVLASRTLPPAPGRWRRAASSSSRQSGDRGFDGPGVTARRARQM